MHIGFTKMHGLGNDFVVIDNMNGRIKLSTEQVVFLCDRNYGVGADGVILVEPSEVADCFMNYYNSDGSIGLCGNGLRCTTKFFKDEILPRNSDQKEFKIDTCAGLKTSEHIGNDIFSVNMGKPSFISEDFKQNLIELEGLPLICVSTGNPHAVAVVLNIDMYDLPTLGPIIEKNENFPNKVNFELVEKVKDGEYRVKVWERGSGVTLACGTGATGVYAVLRKHEEARREVKITLPGGDLFFNENDEGDIIMSGPAESVFSSMIEVK